MELLLLITNPEAAPIASGLAQASQRAGIDWAVFVTNDGVKILQDAALAAVLQKAGSAIVCQDSWRMHMADLPCPLELGSQTNNSALVAQAAHLVSL